MPRCSQVGVRKKCCKGRRLQPPVLARMSQNFRINQNMSQQQLICMRQGRSKTKNFFLLLALCALCKPYRTMVSLQATEQERMDEERFTSTLLLSDQTASETFTFDHGTVVHKIQRYTTSCFRNNSLKNVHLPKVCQGSKTLWGECQKQNPPGTRHCFVPHDCQSTTVSLKGWTYMLNC